MKFPVRLIPTAAALAALILAACTTTPEGGGATAAASADDKCASERVVQTGSILKRCPDKDSTTSITMSPDDRRIISTPPIDPTRQR